MLNIQFMEKVATLAQKGKLAPEKIVLVGSSAEYGRMYVEPISENFPLHPTSIYGLTKIFLFNTAMYYFEKGLPVVYARQFNCTGPYQRPDFVVPSICRQIAMIEKGLQDRIIVGDVSQRRDFIDVRDAARAYMLLFEQGHAGEVYNIGSGNAVSISAVFEKAISLAHSPTKIMAEVNRQLFFSENATSNTICADVAKLACLGFKTNYSMDETIVDVINFWRERV
jgi:GDP-4-dehydro-6-deoxy-D-mannose reductase